MLLTQEISPLKAAAVAVSPVSPDQLYRPADLTQLPFTTTADLVPLPALAEQLRVRGAIDVGIGADRQGFHIFVAGSNSSRMRESVLNLLTEKSEKQPRPLDWVYVNNFASPQKPHCLALPYGRAPELHKSVHELLEELKVSLPSVFESDEYQKRRSTIEESMRNRGEQIFSDLQKRAAAKNVAILRGPMGFVVAPARNGEIVSQSEISNWDEAQRQEARATVKDLEKELEATLRSIPRLQKELRDQIRHLDRETAQVASSQPFDEIQAQFADIPDVVTHLEAIHTDLLENIHLLMPSAEESDSPSAARHIDGGPFERYEVNVLVTRPDHAEGAPVIEELHPSLGNLLGRTEYISIQGTLVTNFLLIRAGAMHRANGGTILLDVRSLLQEPFSWAALKRVLSRGTIVIEDVAHFLGLTATASLDPEPIPLHVKVVLFGDRLLYYLLQAWDPEFGRHFKILADFDEETNRSAGGEEVLARMIAALVAEEKLKPLERAAVAFVIERSSRMAEDTEKLTLLTGKIRDLIAEADYWAEQAGNTLITRADVSRAVDEQIRRASRIRERSQEAIRRGIALVETAGARTGQVNGLSVIAQGDYSFGRPGRITCRVRPGSGKIVDIEREVELGGPIHSKGVLILAGFLAGRYALDTPMSLYASLVFEQSYGGVEGDSASSGELYALLSAIADVPLRQDLAVTGSVNQLGKVQAIGGVNDKIEGFFDVCRQRGLTGTQGVLIPRANVQHLMLRADVVEACASGQFAVYPIETVDEGIALLTGVEAGQRGSDGNYPDGSVNYLVEQRLRTFAYVRRSQPDRGEEELH